MRVLLILVLLDGIYLGMLGSVDIADAAVGLAGAALLVWWFHDHVLPPGHGTARDFLGRLVWLPPFTVMVLARAVRGAAVIGWGILRGDQFESARLVDVPIGSRTEEGVVITGLVESLSPGSVLVEVDDERQMMVFHYATAGKPDAIREDLARFYDRWQRRIFP